MAKVRTRAQVHVQVTLEIDEEELMALDALAGYGADPFLKVFYEKLGAHYLEPHEAGLRRLFTEVRTHAGRIQKKSQDARDVFDGVKVAASKEAA